MYFDSDDINRRSALIKITILATFGVSLLIGLSIKTVIPSIEKDILENVSAKLLENKISNILISVKGQEVTLEGLVTQEIQTQTIGLVSQLKEVSKVNSEFIIVEPEPHKGKTK